MPPIAPSRSARLRAAIGVLACAGGLALSAAAAAPAAPATGRGTPTPAARLLIGRSIEGRGITALRIGDPAARRRVLVVGCIHGNECAGVAIVRRVSRIRPPRGVQVWLIESLNPDGRAHHTRANARGVDLNRNFGYRWRRLGSRGEPEWSGPHALSEPEARAGLALIRRIRPDLSIWYHQALGVVDDSGGDPGIERRYSRLAGLPFRCLPRYPGSVTTWQDHAFPRSTAFVVELRAGRLHGPAIARHLRAVRSVELGHRTPGPDPCGPGRSPHL